MFRRLTEQDHYQVLEVSYTASSDEIQSAYEVARDIYSHDALVSGSILTDNERRRTFDRISEAYQTLIAEESRRLYNVRIGIVDESVRAFGDGDIGSSAAPQDVEAELDDAAPRLDASSEPATSRPPTPRPATPRRCPIQLKPAEEVTGEFLRKAREAMGLELSTISEETKIGRAILEYIEDERVDRLPASVYLRNFTRQVARCLGLDEERVSTSYLDRIRRFSN
jgi:hypothetical protein